MSLIERLKRVEWPRYKQVFVLSLVLLAYLLIGAAVFEALEKPHEEEAAKELRLTFENFVNQSGLSEDEIRNFTSIIQRLSTVAGSADLQNWAFAPSFFFALTVVTTIGMCPQN